jgi:hypothetical protein
MCGRHSRESEGALQGRTPINPSSAFTSDFHFRGNGNHWAYASIATSGPLEREVLIIEVPLSRTSLEYGEIP